MAKDEPYQPSPDLVRYFAGRGEEAIENMQTLVNLARDMLASGTLTEEDVTAYPWELDRDSAAGPPRIWAAAMSDYATGAGLTTTLYAALATSEAGLRQQLSREFNRHEANAAIVARGLDELEKLEPGISTLASSLMKERLLALDRREDRAAAFSYLARTYANYA